MDTRNENTAQQLARIALAIKLGLISEEKVDKMLEELLG